MTAARLSVLRERLGGAERGLTLVETMIAATLMVTVLAIMGPVLTSSLGMTQNFYSQSGSLDEAQNAMNRIDRELRSACNVITPNNGSPPASLMGSTLDFKTNALTGSSTPYEVKYQVTGGYLTRSVLSGGTWLGPVKVAEGLVTTNSEFTYGPAPSGGTSQITVALTVAFKTSPKRQLKSTVDTRNTWGPVAC